MVFNVSISTSIKDSERIDRDSGNGIKSSRLLELIIR